jgi:hypothetical protein
MIRMVKIHRKRRRTRTHRNYWAKLRVIGHVIGLSSIIACVLLQTWSFFEIAEYGSIQVYENNTTILTIEIIGSLYALAYCIFLVKKLKS